MFEIAAWTAFLKYLFHTLDVHITIAKLSKAHLLFLKYPGNSLEKVTWNFEARKFSLLVHELLQEL